MSDRKQENMLDWSNMSTASTKGGMYDQLERLYLANEYRIGTLEARFVNCIHSNVSNGELIKLIDKISTDKEKIEGNDTISYPLSDIPYQYWTYEMLIIHGEVKAIYHQNEMIETILEQNKPSLLADHPDQQE